jgi:ankyrin repeat protein
LGFLNLLGGHFGSADEHNVDVLTIILTKLESKELDFNQMNRFVRNRILNATSIQGQTVLHISVLKDFENCLSLLTDNKKDSKNGLNILTDQNFYVNVRNKNGETALHLAASNNKDDLAKILIENEANVNAKVLYTRTNY